MLDPQAECPECGQKLGASNTCRECGWKPVYKPERATLPNWEPPVEEDRGGAVDPEWLRATLDGLYKKFGVPLPTEGKRITATTIQRCQKCDGGNFKHNGVTYCLTCYQRL